MTPVSRAEDEIIYERLRKFIRHCETIDLGCATGCLLEHFGLLPNEYVGVDISPAMLNLARLKFPNYEFRYADMRALPFENETFDNAVALYGSISYAGPTAIIEAMRVLRRGGRYFFMLYTPKYRKRKSYILNKHHLKAKVWNCYDLLLYMPNNVTIEPFNYSGDALNWLHSVSAVRRLLRAEPHIFKWARMPYFFLVSGVKD